MILTILYVILCIIALILIFSFALLYVPMDVGVEYIVKGEEKKLFLRFKLFKILPLKIPLKEKEEKKQKKEISPKKKFKLKDFLHFASSVAHTYEEIKEDIKEIVSDIKEKATFKEVELDVYFGTENAAKTGIMTGAVSGGAHLLLAVINRVFGVEKFHVDVTPCFEKKFFNVYFKSILNVRLVNIIIIINKIIFVINKFKENTITNKEKAVL